MVTAIVLIRANEREIHPLAERLSEIHGVTEVYSVAGEFDLVALVRVPRLEDLEELVTRRIAREPGIERTETLTAFKAYSQYDLERIFSIGLPEDGASA